MPTTRRGNTKQPAGEWNTAFSRSSAQGSSSLHLPPAAVKYEEPSKPNADYHRNYIGWSKGGRRPVGRPDSITVFKKETERLGCTLDNMVLAAVEDGTPAARTGLASHIGKKVATVNNFPVKSLDDVRNIIKGTHVVHIKFENEGSEAVPRTGRKTLTGPESKAEQPRVTSRKRAESARPQHRIIGVDDTAPVSVLRDVPPAFHYAPYGTSACDPPPQQPLPMGPPGYIPSSPRPSSPSVEHSPSPTPSARRKDLRDPTARPASSSQLYQGRRPAGRFGGYWNRTSGELHAMRAASADPPHRPRSATPPPSSAYSPSPLRWRCGLVHRRGHGDIIKHGPPQTPEEVEWTRQQLTPRRGPRLVSPNPPRAPSPSGRLHCTPAHSQHYDGKFLVRGGSDHHQLLWPHNTTGSASERRLLRPGWDPKEGQREGRRSSKMIHGPVRVDLPKPRYKYQGPTHKHPHPCPAESDIFNLESYKPKSCADMMDVVKTQGKGCVRQVYTRGTESSISFAWDTSRPRAAGPQRASTPAPPPKADWV